MDRQVVHLIKLRNAVHRYEVHYDVRDVVEGCSENETHRFNRQIDNQLHHANSYRYLNFISESLGVIKHELYPHNGIIDLRLLSDMENNGAEEFGTYYTENKHLSVVILCQDKLVII